MKLFVPRCKETVSQNLFNWACSLMKNHKDYTNSHTKHSPSSASNKAVSII